MGFATKYPKLVRSYYNAVTPYELVYSMDALVELRGTETAMALYTTE
jgi:hypothetical protein